jgi:hypothetical protein
MGFGGETVAGGGAGSAGENKATASSNVLAAIADEVAAAIFIDDSETGAGVDDVAVGSAADSPGSAQPAGGCTSTIPWHLGHAKIWPMAARSRTFSRL